MRWAFGLLCVMGCGDFTAFDQLLIEPACAEWDAWCRGQTLSTRVAQDARLDLRLGTRTTLTSSERVTLESSDPFVFDIEDKTIIGRNPGTAVLLFRDDDGRLLDYTHVTVEEVLDVALYREGELEPEAFTASTILEMGESVRIRAVPRGPSGPLLGDIETTYEVTGTDVDAISLAPGERSVERVMAAIGVGMATLEVRQGALTDTLQVRVP